MPDSAERQRVMAGSGSTFHVPSSRVQVDVGATTDRGLVRESNEDAYGVFRMGRYLESLKTNLPESDLPARSDDLGYVMIVADGVGGHQAGEVASHTTIAATLELIAQSAHWSLKLDDPATRDEELREIQSQAPLFLAAMNQAVRQRAHQDPRLAGMGTTFTGAYSVGLDLFVMHVGDSKAYLFREGVLRRITRDHTVAQEYADRGVIAQEEVATHELHHVLTRAVTGKAEAPEGDFYHVRLAPGDRVLLCSDGLTDMVAESEIATLLAERKAGDEVSRALVRLALEHGGRDNVTVIVAGYAVD